MPERRALVLLLVALGALFIVGSDSDRFYRWDFDRAGVSFNHLTVAENRSYEHGFLGFYHQFVDAAGERAYAPYNRFPITGYLLIKAATAPFADLSDRVQSARMLMLAFFAASIAAAYFALRRLTANPSVALAATLLAFSSYYPLRYADLVAAEAPMDLFAVTLAFHGLVLFDQQGRTGQLLAKTGVAALIGWHAFMLLAPFFALRLAGEWRRGKGGACYRSGRLLRSRHLLLGVVTLSFGVSMLALNFALESRAYNGTGERHAAPQQLPSYRSAVRVLGLNASFNERHRDEVGWRPALAKLVQRSGRAFVPYCVEHWGRTLLTTEQPAADAAPSTRPYPRDANGRRPLPPPSSERHDTGSASYRTASLLAGAAVLLVGAIAVAFAQHRALMASLATCGLLWGLLTRGTVPLNAFEGMFLVGLPLVVYSVVLLWARRRFERLVDGCAGIAPLVFALSAALAWRGVHDPTAPEFRPLMSDFETIRALAPEGSVVVGFDKLPKTPTNYLLTGRAYLAPLNGAQRQRADFVLARERTNDAGLLTPHNRYLFLYDRRAFDARYATLGVPFIEGGRGFGVHRVGNRLIYTSGEDCQARQGFKHEPAFFLEAFPAEAPPGYRSRSIFPERRLVRRTEFRFDASGFEVAGRCVVEATLPAYDIAKLRTGQFAADGVLWVVEATPPDLS